MKIRHICHAYLNNSGKKIIIDAINNDNATKETKIMDYFDVASLVVHDYDDEDNWIHSVKHLQQSVVNCGYFILFLILSSTTTNNDRVNGVDNNDNASIGVEKYGFSFKNMVQ